MSKCKCIICLLLVVVVALGCGLFLCNNSNEKAIVISDATLV